MSNPCSVCGSGAGSCCLYFSLPDLTLTFMRSKGVPILAYVTPVNTDPENYFRRRLGIRVIGKRFAERFVLEPDLPVLPFRSKRWGRRLIACSPCRELLNDGACRIWGKPERPMTCGAMTMGNLEKFLVPMGCRLDPCGIYGENYSAIIAAAREYRERMLELIEEKP